MNLHSMLHVFHNTFIINNVGSLWQWMGEGAKVGKKDKAGQSLLLSCCKPLVLFSFIFLKRTMLDIKSKNLRHSGPTICLVCWPWRVSFQPLSRPLCLKNAVLRDFTLFLHYHCHHSFSFILTGFCSVSFPYLLAWKTCTFMFWG